MTNFPQGNLDSWNFTITSYFPQMIKKIEIVDATCQAALKALVGDSFSGKAGHLDFKFGKDQAPTYVKVILVYEVTPFKLSYASEEAIAHDTAVIQSYLNQVQFISKDKQQDNAKIDTEKGSVTVTFELSITGV